MDGSNIITKSDLADAVRATSLLADLTISVWSGERADRTIIDEAKATHNAVGNVGRATKNLLAGCDTSLKATRTAYLTARQMHYQLTLPWVSNPHAERQVGARLLPTMLFERYLDQMTRLKRAAEDKLALFVDEYPALIQQAMGNLGSLAKASDYPSIDYIKSAFRLTFGFEPIPPAQAFRGLPDAFMGRLSQALEARQRAASQAAQAAMWERVSEHIGHLIDRLDDPEAKFKTSTVEGVRELITLLPGFNVTDDERVATVVEDIKVMLAGVDAKSLREDARLRSDVCTQARALSHKLSAWGV